VEEGGNFVLTLGEKKNTLVLLTGRPGYASSGPGKEKTPFKEV